MISLIDFIKLIQVFGYDHPITETVINAVKNENKHP